MCGFIKITTPTPVAKLYPVSISGTVSRVDYSFKDGTSKMEPLISISMQQAVSPMKWSLLLSPIYLAVFCTFLSGSSFSHPPLPLYPPPPPPPTHTHIILHVLDTRTSEQSTRVQSNPRVPSPILGERIY